MGEKFEGKLDELKGRGKQAAGDLTDRDDLKTEGKVDEGEGKVRQKVGEAGEKIGDAASKVGDKIKDATDR
ncbi:MAG TPA: CsbD family protein [Actinomycetota bacterium]|nr:CsbD family protein [Actinomycetota bacterium]